MSQNGPERPGHLPRDFMTTHWSLVAAVRRGDGVDDGGSAAAHRALAELCRLYWYPLYAFVRSRGHGPEQAQDLTQAFFTRLLETEGLATADPDLGRFRSYLLGAMKHFLTNAWRRGATRKRGGGVDILDLDAFDPEARYALEPASRDDPDAVFDREWAATTLDRALDRLRRDYADRGHGEVFDALKGSLTGGEFDRGEAARRLDLADGAVKVAIHRLRRRFRRSIRAEIAETVLDPADIDGEMRDLVDILRKK
ncbi:MAG: sigma-70 family RNA polymerase sigma factor [Acidobacteriota bacterium]